MDLGYLSTRSLGTGAASGAGLRAVCHPASSGGILPTRRRPFRHEHAQRTWVYREAQRRFEGDRLAVYPGPHHSRQGRPSPGARTSSGVKRVGTLWHRAMFPRAAVRVHRACWRRARRSATFPVSRRWRWPSLSHRANSYGLLETTTATTLSSGASSGGVIRSARRSSGSEKTAWSFACATPSLSSL